MNDNITPADLTPKTALPLTHSVLLLEHRESGPWPLLAVEFRSDGHVRLKGPEHAAAAAGYLIEAARLALRQITEDDMHRALRAPHDHQP